MRYIICKEFGWDFFTYEAQPPFFLDEIGIFMMQESEKQQEDSKSVKIKQKSQGVKRN